MVRTQVQEREDGLNEPDKKRLCKSASPWRTHIHNVLKDTFMLMQIMLMQQHPKFQCETYLCQCKAR